MLFAGFAENAGAPSVLSVSPHAGVTVVIELGGNMVVGQRDRSGSHDSFIAGIRTESLKVQQPAKVECLEVRMSPVAAWSLLPVSPKDLFGAIVTLDELWGADGLRTLDRLHDMDSWTSRFRVVADLILRHAPRRAAIAPEIATAWSIIRARRGQVTVEALATATGWSRQRLWRACNSQLGLSPKRLTMLTRFEHANELLMTGLPPSYVAAECGYTDQSHLHRDVLAFAGRTPSELARSDPAAPR